MSFDDQDDHRWYDISCALAQAQLAHAFEETQSCIARGDLAGVIRAWQAITPETKRRYYELSHEYDPFNQDPSIQQVGAHWEALWAQVHSSVFPPATQARAEEGGGLPQDHGRQHHPTRYGHHQHLHRQDEEPRHRQAGGPYFRDVGYPRREAVHSRGYHQNPTHLHSRSSAGLHQARHHRS